jgi:hypothetical protein
MVKKNIKNSQLQIRVSAKEKLSLKQRAKQAGCDVSSWVLRKLFPAFSTRFEAVVTALNETSDYSYAFAELHDLLAQSSALELKELGDYPITLPDDAFKANYIAAMVEHAASQRSLAPPHWTLNLPTLTRPYFASDLKTLRLLLLRDSPPAFKRRNIFIDSSVGARI